MGPFWVKRFPKEQLGSGCWICTNGLLAYEAGEITTSPIRHIQTQNRYIELFGGCVNIYFQFKITKMIIRKKSSIIRWLAPAKYRTTEGCPS